MVVGWLAAIAAVQAAPRDPTQPPPRLSGSVGNHAASGGATPTLSSVLFGADRRLAVLDGKVMAEGEERFGLKVWKIERDRVVVSVDGQTPITLLLDRAAIHKVVR